jgi:hypothetical protein
MHAQWNQVPSLNLFSVPPQSSCYQEQERFLETASMIRACWTSNLDPFRSCAFSNGMEVQMRSCVHASSPDPMGCLIRSSSRLCALQGDILEDAAQPAARERCMQTTEILSHGRRGRTNSNPISYHLHGWHKLPFC